MVFEIAHSQTVQWEDLLQRVRLGFALRARQAQNARRRLKSPPANQDIIRIINAIPFDGYQMRGDTSDHRFFQVSATIDTARFRLQQAIVSTVSDATDVGIVSALALGFLRNEHGFDLAETYRLPDQEISIIIESFCRFGRHTNDLPQYVIDEVIGLSHTFVASVLD